MKIPCADWEVKLSRETGSEPEYEHVQVNARTEEDARESALQEASGDDWEARDANRLCDFCEPAPHPRVEAANSITVVNDWDVMDEPAGEDAPDRCAWVCLEHYKVAKSLPTYRAAE